MTCNFREWMHVCTLRCSGAAHPKMRQLASMALDLLYEKCPVVFEELYTMRERQMLAA